MKAIILAAGEGVRMRPLTLTKPKPLLEVAGKPLICRLIENLPDSVGEVIVVIGYLGEKIKDYLGEEFFGKKISYVWQNEKKGTFHALELCKDYVNDGEKFGVFWADDLIDEQTIANCLSEDLAVTVSEVDDPRPFGVVSIDKDGNIEEIIEKPTHPKSKLVVANGLALNKKIFDYRPEPHPNGEYYLPVAVQKMLKDHPLKAVRARFWLPLGTPEDLEKAEKILLL